MSNDDVTVVITCFDYGQYLPEAVDSALKQEGGPARVIVVDDGSTDPETLEALDRLPQEVEVLRRGNEGVCRARNAGLARARTSYVCVLDADDRLAVGALQALKRPLDPDPRLGFAYGRMRFFGDWEGVLTFPPYDAYRLLYRHTIGLSSLMRREVVEDTGGFDPDFQQFEDWELWLNALAHGWRGAQIEAVTIEYRRHGSTKVAADRRRYRSAYRSLLKKHSALYARRNAFAAESELGSLGRLVYRYYWGPRPIPARLEGFFYRLRWGSPAAAAD